MKLNIKKLILLGIFLSTNNLSASHTSILSDEFVAYHLSAATEEIDDVDIFNLIQELIDTLYYSSTSDASTNELINLIEEGYKIDPFNMSKLIHSLYYMTPSNNATKVIIKAIECNSSITVEHMINLMEALRYTTPCNNATTIIIKAIEHGVKFGLKERLKLAELSKLSNAKNNVEKIRRALHQREINS